VAPAISRVTLVRSQHQGVARHERHRGFRSAPAGKHRRPSLGRCRSWLPVSFTRGTLLGGLDAPTGGQAQSNPHPVLIRLSDTAVLPNRVPW
jgi:conjugal transfer pilus assembly protein TraB